MTRLTEEGGGFTVTCDCLWLRWYDTKPAALTGLRDHGEKCKGPRAPKPERTATRGRSTWTEREGSTWIDKL